MLKKDDELGNKTAYKKKRKGKKKRVRKKFEIGSPKAEIRSWVLQISFLAIPMLTGRKTVQKEGFGPKCGFSLYKNWLTAKR